MSRALKINEIVQIVRNGINTKGLPLMSSFLEVFESVTERIGKFCKIEYFIRLNVLDFNYHVI